MNAAKTQRLAELFRAAIERAIECGAISICNTKTPLPNFPKGCCEVASELLAEYLLKNGIMTKRIHGEYNYDYCENRFPHSWLETEDGYIIDITADQFRKYSVFNQFELSPCYVGKRNEFYDLFKDDYRNDGIFRGFEFISDYDVKNVKPLYDIVFNHLS